uniref:Uncharacterized protein n=1 Tax=Octopus bimaculoides TaxID=37653 RepID=A0A0L8GA70_OCTBM
MIILKLCSFCFKSSSILTKSQRTSSSISVQESSRKCANILKRLSCKKKYSVLSRRLRNTGNFSTVAMEPISIIPSHCSTRPLQANFFPCGISLSRIVSN